MPSDRGRTKKESALSDYCVSVTANRVLGPHDGRHIGVCVCVAYLQANFLSHFNTELKLGMDRFVTEKCCKM